MSGGISDWDDISAEHAEVIRTLRDGGVFLDQWHWRAARGNAIGVSDDMWVLDYRNGDAGQSAYSTNMDSETGQPKKMFDPDKVGFAALSFDDVRNARIPFDGVSYLSDATMKDYDPSYPWKEGDALPRRYLRAPEGSRSDISASGRWDDGWWTVELRRRLDTGNPDDKALRDRATYSLAFAFYTEATGNRFHYVTFPGQARPQPAGGHRCPPVRWRRARLDIRRAHRADELLPWSDQLAVHHQRPTPGRACGPQRQRFLRLLPLR